ncbi:YcxB family protein [Fusobacterium sp. PH5-44]|uniref:YcxB family protein n=1 Tax=unclassified Fusobacterium TaxID=2648384 RepID=UPI003D1E7705
MDTLFENKYYLDKESLIEYIKDIFCKYSRVTGLFFICVSIFYTYLSFTMKSINLIMAILTIFLYIISFRLVFYHTVYIKNMRKTSLALHNGTIPESIFQFTENNIILKEGKIQMEFEYNQIKKIKEYSNTIVLMIGKKNGLLLKKDGFSIGTFENFKKFIAEKSNINQE